MNKIVLIILVIVAFIFSGLGIGIAFVDLEKFCIQINNHGYISAIFSLSGIILYFTALMYQVKEYKLQVIELKKSVEAQTKSSKALEEQKTLLLEQNTSSLIFEMINSFHSFKERNNTEKIVNELCDFYRGIFALRWQNNVVELRLNKEELNIKFANDIKEMFNESIIKHPYYYDCHKFIQFAYNILYLIDINKPNIGEANFTPFFFNQLNTKEMMLIYLANLNTFDMPHYDNLHWSYYNTKEIIDFIGADKNNININFSEIDLHILTKEFSKLKQNKTV